MGSKRAKLMVLLLDDNPNFLYRVKEQLPDNEFEIITAINGKDGLEKFKKARGNFNIVITDFNMPLVGGILVCKEIKKSCPTMKVVLWTDNIEQLEELGEKPAADKVLDKIENLDDIKEIVLKLIKK